MQVLEAVRQRRPLLMYIDGRSGRGKTLLMKTIIAAVRAQGEVVTCSATAGLAGLNYEGGTTAHATFKIPVTDSEDTPVCNVPNCCPAHLGRAPNGPSTSYRGGEPLSV